MNHNGYSEKNFLNMVKDMPELDLYKSLLASSVEKNNDIMKIREIVDEMNDDMRIMRTQMNSILSAHRRKKIANLFGLSKKVKRK